MTVVNGRCLTVGCDYFSLAFLLDGSFNIRPRLSTRHLEGRIENVFILWRLLFHSYAAINRRYKSCSLANR